MLYLWLSLALAIFHRSPFFFTGGHVPKNGKVSISIHIPQQLQQEQIGFLLDELFDGAANLEALARHPFATWN